MTQVLIPVNFRPEYHDYTTIRVYPAAENGIRPGDSRHADLIDKAASIQPATDIVKAKTVGRAPRKRQYEALAYSFARAR